LHDITYEGRGYKDKYWKLLKTGGGWEVKWLGRIMERVEWTKVNYTHSMDALRIPFEHWLKYFFLINNFYYNSHTSQGCSKGARVVWKYKFRFVQSLYLHNGSRAIPTSGIAAAVVRCFCAALDILGTAHGASGVATLLAGGAFALLALVGASTGAGVTRCSWGASQVPGRLQMSQKAEAMWLLEGWLAY
jgi:hypothetical protein